MLKLEKGGRLNLSKEGGLDFVEVLLKWTSKKFDSQADFDLDATAFVLKEDGSQFGAVLTIPNADDGWVCFYNQKVLGDNAVVYAGDSRTGGEERIQIDFKKLPAEAARIAIVVTIHDQETTKQNFGQIEEAHAYIVDKTGTMRADYDLDENSSVSTALIFVEFKKNGAGEWVLNAVGEGFKQGLEGFFKAFKVPGF